jgi:hypothetical protein
MNAHEVHTCEIHAREMHAHEVHAMHAREMYESNDAGNLPYAGQGVGHRSCPLSTAACQAPSPQPRPGPRPQQRSLKPSRHSRLAFIGKALILKMAVSFGFS